MSTIYTSHSGVMDRWFPWLYLFSLTISCQWFRDTHSLGLDLITRKLTRCEYSMVIRIPYLVNMTIMLCRLERTHVSAPVVEETGFEFTLQHVRLSWRRSLVADRENPGFYWLRFWSDLLGIRKGNPYIKKLLASETYHFYQVPNEEGFRLGEVEVEAVLMGQKVQGRWWWPWEREETWVEIHPSSPIQTRMKVITRHVYERPTLVQRHQPLQAFLEDLVKMGIFSR